MSETFHPTLTTSAATRPSSGRRRLTRWAVAVLALAAVGCAIVLLGFSGSSAKVDRPATAKVVRGPLRISINESGEVKAEKNKTITNDLRWPVVIEELAPEGRVVQKGQVIARFSCQELTDAIDDQKLKTQSADDEYTAALSNYDIKKLQKEARVRRAGAALDDARNDVEKYEQAEWPQAQDDAEANIQLAERDRKLAEHKLASKLKINEDPELGKPYSQNEIDAEILSVERLKIALSRANTQKQILVKYGYPRALRNKKTALLDAEMDLKAANTERDNEMAVAKTLRDSTEFTRTKQREKLQQLLNDANTKIKFVAEEPSLVVYDTRRRPWDRPITVAVGEKIQPTQQLMVLPDMSTLQIETRVYEAVREQVKEGLKAKVRLDAKRGSYISGHVTKVNPLPDNQNPWLSPGVKQYPAIVTLDEKLEGLKPGMTADAEIILDELEDVLSVPIAAVFAEGEQNFCYRIDSSGRVQRVNITVGKTNDTEAQVLSGLTEGEQVLLAPPPGVTITPKGRRDSASQPASQPSAQADSVPPTGTRPADAGPRDREGRNAGRRARGPNNGEPR